MLVAVSDTHGTDGHRLRGRTLKAVRQAEAVIHTGDFHTESVLDAFLDENRALHAVWGNNDETEVRERLPREITVKYGDVTIAAVHGTRKTPTELSLFGREQEADLVVFGHSHRPEFVLEDELALLNPGSHAEPRRYRPAHAELELTDGMLKGRLVSPDGDTYERFSVAHAESENG